MIRDTISDDMINLRLRQAGAKSIKTNRAHINVVKFEISEDINITYLYEIKESNEIYLQRVNPYTMMIGRFYSDKDLIHMLLRDVEFFRNAKNSSNYEKFVEIERAYIKYSKDLEDLFIEYNVSSEDLDKILYGFEKGLELLNKIRERSEPLDIEKIVDEK